MTVLMPDKVVVRGPDRFVKGDNRTQMVWFTVPRYRDGVDLSGLGWLIHIRNAAGVETTAQPVDGTPEVRTDKIMIGWLVHGTATAAAGDMTFSLRGAGNDDAGNPMRWCSGDEVRPVCDAQESFSSSDSEAPVTILEQLVQLVQVELPEVRDAAEAATASANSAAAEASERAGLATVAANDANVAAAEARNQANGASAQADRANAAAAEAEQAANKAYAAASDASEKGNAAVEAAAEAKTAAYDALRQAQELELTVSEAEAQRVAAEKSREKTEKERAEAENERRAAETERQTSEAIRADAEVQRAASEEERTAVYTEQKIASDAATTAATLAAKNAQDAADAVGAAVYNKAPAVVCSAAGEMIAVHDASDMPAHGLRLFGKTTQNGTPSFDAPIDLVSAGDDGGIAIQVTGANLIDISKAVPVMGSTLSVDGDTITVTGSAAFARAEIPLDAGMLSGKTVTLSLDEYSSSNSNAIINVQLYYEDVSLNKKVYISNIQNTARAHSIAAAISNVKIQIAVNNTSTALEEPNTVRITGLRMTLGDAVLSYEPYKNGGSIELQTPGGLPGIPVTSGGGYTDENGQQWVCDEIDLARGVYVQRVGQKRYDGSTAITLSAEGVFVFNIPNTLKIDASNQNTLIGVRCSHYRATYWADISSAKNTGCALKWGNGIGIRDSRFTTASEFKTFAQENPITVYYIMANPVETPLAAEEIAAFKALRTSKPNTTVLNDSGAGMQLDYAADTKIYIDNKFAELAAAMVANA